MSIVSMTSCPLVTALPEAAGSVFRAVARASGLPLFPVHASAAVVVRVFRRAVTLQPFLLHIVIRF